MFTDHGHHLFLLAHLWATETHRAPKGANEGFSYREFYKHCAATRLKRS
jgi:hypothetical protein